MLQAHMRLGWEMLVELQAHMRCQYEVEGEQMMVQVQAETDLGWEMLVEEVGMVW